MDIFSNPSSNKYTLNKQKILYEGKHSLLYEEAVLNSLGKLDCIFFGYKAVESGFPVPGLTSPRNDLYDSMPLVLVTQVSRVKSSGKVLLTGMNVNYLDSKFDRGRVILSTRLKGNITKRLYRQMVHSYRIDRLQTPVYKIPSVTADAEILNTFGDFKEISRNS